jgi:hypothetical protein
MKDRKFSLKHGLGGLPKKLSEKEMRGIVGYRHCVKLRGVRVLGVWGCPKPNPLKSTNDFEVLGERGRIRTCDPCLKRALLYHLSYAPA